MYTVICPCCNIQVKPTIYSHSNTTHGNTYNGLFIHVSQHPLSCNQIFAHIIHNANSNKSIGKGLTLSDTDIQTFQSNIDQAYHVFILKDF